MLFEPFIIPLYIKKLDVDLKEILSELRKFNHTSHDLVVGGVSTFNDDFSILNHISGLEETIQKEINDYTTTIGLCETRITNSWDNIYNKGAKVLHHHHHGSVISGAYYAKAGDDSSPIIFENPFYKFRGAEESVEYTPYSCAENKFDIEDGMLILFPSWITHYTLPNESDERIVISFNTEHTNED